MYRIRTLPALVLGAGLLLSGGSLHAEPIFGNPSSALSSGAARPDLDALNRGHAALRAQRYDQAQKAFGEAYKQNPRSMEAMLGLAAVSQAQGQAKLARDWMSSAVAMAPGQAGVLQAQARMLVEQGLPELAEESYRGAINAHPGLPQLKLDLAALYTEKLGKPAEAVSVLRELIRQSPAFPGAHLQLGLALSADGKLDEAARALDEATQRAPGDPLAIYARGLLALKQGQAERALGLFDKALGLRRDFAGAMLAKGDALQTLGKPDQAIETYRRAAALAPTSALPHALAAQTFERSRRLAEAEQAYREALRLEPANSAVSNNLAFLLASQRIKLDEAFQLSQRASAREPANATFLDTLGAVQLARGDAAAARQAFERAQALAPGNAAIRQHLAQLGAAAAPKGGPLAALPAAPAAAPAAAAAPADEAVRLVAARLEAWRQAWEAKDATRYLAFYARSFVPPEQRARAAWEAERRLKLGRKGEIRVSIAAPAYARQGELVTSGFEQHYVSGSFADTARKQLEWVREDGEWKIRREVLQ